VCRQGLIEAVGYDEDIKVAYCSAMFDNVIDATDKCIIPGRNLSTLQYIIHPLVCPLLIGAAW